MQHLQTNTTLQGGKYRIERVLGQGGFGITYLVDQTGVHKQLVVKELFIRGVNDRADDQTKVTVSNAVNVYSFSQQKEKFKKEAMRLFELRNPHIVRIYDFFEENDTAYYVMEYIKGKSLADKLKSASLSESTMEKYMSQMLDALSAIHGKHLWHLDIKPANIMICDGNAVLIDFGASKHIDSNSTLMTSSAIAYTPGFAAPEQLDGDITKFGPWTDFYALGATMYQLLTLNRPPSSSEIFTKGKNAFVFSGISEKMQHLILWMMKPNRMERPQSVSNVISYFCKEDKRVINEDEIRNEAYNLKFGKENGASYEASQERHYLNHDEIQEKVRNRKDKHLYRALLWFVGMSLLISLLAIYFFSRILGIAGVLTISFIPSIEQSLLIGSIIAGILTRFFYDEL